MSPTDNKTKHPEATHSFNYGDKVRCISLESKLSGWFNAHALKVGEVYTVGNVFQSPDRIGICKSNIFPHDLFELVIDVDSLDEKIAAMEARLNKKETF